MATARSVIDDFAVLAMDHAQAKLAFQVISERYEYRRSTGVTTNRAFKDWPKVFPDALNAEVIAKRLTELRRRSATDPISATLEIQFASTPNGGTRWLARRRSA